MNFYYKISIVFALLLFIKAVLANPHINAWINGKIGEWIVKRRLKKLPLGFHVFHDVLLPNDDNTSQIDHIVVSPYGVFSIETKNYQGWIYGTESQYQWTQVFGKRKFNFYNPVIQNKRHIKALDNIIHEPNIHSIIVFTNGTLKSEFPEYVMHSKSIVKYINRFCDIVVDDIRLIEIINKIKTANIIDPILRKAHIEYAKSVKSQVKSNK